ncbi:hypothetical protein J7T55_011023 [Diaporthe amygdali]|uniref:uncharacterized protein n=1 Tax=Phomopsis amygdali TaxID=1214568 RepID=UPI0022FDF848|nr:uncharacterized protein J7T55_011023 [Diaporthe amygdali]KAJ0106928.1 hypothetical protein J7T55_011023 [Diaporthe amygdali]
MSSSNQAPASRLVEQARKTVAKAVEYAWDIAELDGHWCGELRSNVTMTAEQIFFYLVIHPDMKEIPCADEYRRYLLGQQQDDGSWSIAPEHPGDVSTSCEAYLALKILGESPDAPEMDLARRFILSSGGVEKVRIFTRFFFAQFGLFPWDATPQLPVEFILVPPSVPMNVYKLSSWARLTIIPMLIIAHHRPVYALPNGHSAKNTFLDEIWRNPLDKMVPLVPSFQEMFSSGYLSFAFSAVDKVLFWLGGLRRNPLRQYARQQCVKWILERQEPSGDFAGYIPPMHAGVHALLLEGYNVDSDPVRLGIEALERFTWQDERGKRLQACPSPVWDTVLMTRGLCDAGVSVDDPRLEKAVDWLKRRQVMGPEGDWRVYSPNSTPGGFSFEYCNEWYPDVDDTAAAILAMISQNPHATHSKAVVHAAKWTCGMQNKDGGWGAFDVDNDKLWLNKIPFSDMDSLCDPSSADVTGHILEAFGLLIQKGREHKIEIDEGLLDQIVLASHRGISYLARTQETSSAWYGRWGVNYIYGTSNVLCGLSYFTEDDQVMSMTLNGSQWIKTVQNSDGGWGESLETYRDPEKQGIGSSTPSQTAWALMALLTTCTSTDEAVVRGVEYLIRNQNDVRGKGISWSENLFTGTGFPNFLYMGYTLYRHYFPLMALGRFISLSGESASIRLGELI